MYLHVNDYDCGGKLYVHFVVLLAIYKYISIRTSLNRGHVCRQSQLERFHCITIMCTCIYNMCTIFVYMYLMNQTNNFMLIWMFPHFRG